MNLEIHDLPGPGPGGAPCEIVERKGRGHPDSLCDALAENLSIGLSRFYLERFGAILHHNVDKALLVGGAARPAFGGGEVLEPIEIRGLVVIESEPQGADIYLDSRTSKPLSKTPWNGTLTGEHLVIIERQGYKPIERTIRPDPNKLLVMVFGLGEQDYLGYLDVTSNIPGADIYIDDKSVGAKAKTPWSGDLPPGRHKIWVTKDGQKQPIAASNVSIRVDEPVYAYGGPATARLKRGRSAEAL